MSDRPFLSVIMPTYNGAAFLDRALASMAAERRADLPLEIVAVDDGSDDRTLDILRGWSERLPLTIEARGRGGSWVAATNAGLERARGRYACFLHQDDLWLPGRLEALRAEVVRHPGAVMLLSPSRFIDARDRDCGLWRSPLSTGRLLGACDVLPHLAVQNFIPIPAPVFELEAARAAGRLDESLWFTADWDFWARLAVRGATVYEAAPRTAFRVHALSQTARGSRDTADFRAQYQEAIRRTLELAGQAGCDRLAEVRRAADWSCEVNVALAALAHRQGPDWRSLLRRCPASPRVWRRFIRSSRVFERAGARLRAR